jgi:hypothetical protein
LNGKMQMWPHQFKTVCGTTRDHIYISLPGKFKK